MKNGDMPAMPHTEYDANGNMPKGLSKREHFAAMAMQGFCAAPDMENTSLEDLAEMAVKQADALLDALDQKGVA